MIDSVQSTSVAALSLGRLSRVDLRDVWTHEAHSFTPWLAKEENLKLLGDAIGSDLALEQQEQNVGPFRADLLCKDTANDQWVLVENQIERTDHSHLGQLITYAAGLHAVTIVWVAARFTDEHRAALDWLNEVTGEDISFFGLEVELWRIGDSPAAPKFNVVSKPNQFVKRVIADKQAASPSGNKYQDYWQAFKEYAEEHSKLLKPMKALPQAWTNLSIGKTGYHLVASASLQKQTAIASLVIYDDPEGQRLEQLRAYESELAALHPGAVWNPKPGKKESTIEYRWSNVDVANSDLWNEQHGRMLTALEAIFKVFAPAIKGLP